MTQRMSYLVDLTQISLSEGDTPSSWIHAMTTNTYDHPMYGEIAFTEDRLKRFARSVVDKVREIEPDIDYDHKARTGDAAGWVKNAQVRSDGLYLFVEWTVEAAQKIKSKAYKYFSPEFLDEWEHPKTKTKFQDVISGGALTNRPFLKDLQPVNLSEMLDRSEDPPEGNDMDPKKFAELLGLAEGSSEEDMLAKIKEFMEKAAKPPVLLSDADEELKKLSESNPAIKLLMEQQKQLQEDNNRNKAALRLAEVKGNVFQLGEELRNKNVALPAVTLESLTRILHETTDVTGKAILEMVKALGENGFVTLGETPYKRGSGGDPVKAFSELVTKAQTDHKLSYVDAVSKVALETPEAYEAYVGATRNSGGDN